MSNTSSNTAPRFWESKTLAQMSANEWEQLCDRCGRCCLHKLEDEDDGEVYYTAVGCKLLNVESCNCTHYAERKQHVPDCTVLTLAMVDEFHWLPVTCAYRLLHEGKPLNDWHPLISGNDQSVLEAAISVRGWVYSEQDVNLNELEDYLIPHTMVE